MLLPKFFKYFILIKCMHLSSEPDIDIDVAIEEEIKRLDSSENNQSQVCKCLNINFCLMLFFFALIM